MPGPAPKRFSTRSLSAKPGSPTAWRTLPPEGRKKPAPEWPMGKKMTKAQKDLWCQLWSTPQATVWEDQHIERVIARYVLITLEAELPGATAAVMSEARQLEDKLGLSPMAMARLRWYIPPASEAAVQDTTKTVKVVALDDYRAL